VMVYTVETGLLTSITAVTELTVYLKTSFENWHYILCVFCLNMSSSIPTFVHCSYLAIGRLYANALLASLNSRILIRATRNKPTLNQSDPIEVDLRTGTNSGTDAESGMLERSSPSIEFARPSRTHPWTSSTSGSLGADTSNCSGPNLMKEQGSLALKQLNSLDRT
jgi:hypothetical protein